MYTPVDRLICIPVAVPFAVSTATPVSTRLGFPSAFAPSRAQCRLVFVVVAYSSTSGYVPDNEVQPKLHRLAAQRLIISFECHPFLSGRSDKPAGLP
ncbi:MAG TPA: hypothetical protein VF525_15730 [Pyrinomonadaceae bacterium]|jgi:hypothetical protein